jgi:GT2 family glycosyltransferase
MTDAPQDGNDPVVSIIIPTFNGLEFLRVCLPSACTECAYLSGGSEILVVDNGSTDGSIAYIRQAHPAVQVIPLPSNRGFAEACDAGIRSARGKFCLLLNNDAWFAEGSLARLVAVADDGGYDFAGPAILNPDGTPQWGPQSIDFLGDPADTLPNRLPFSLMGAALLIRRTAYLQLGGFERRFFAFYEETDLQWRARLQKMAIGYAPQAQVYHVGGGTMSGSVVRPGLSISIDRRRLLLARQNQLASLLMNYSIWSILWVVPLWLASAFIECAGALVMGHPEVPRIYRAAVAWNIRNAAETKRRHRDIQAARLASDRELLRYFAPPFTRLRTLLNLARQDTRVHIT